VPFLVYFFPALAPPIQTVEHLQELCEIPNVAGMKFTDYNLYRLERVKRFCRVLYNGHDEVLAAGLLMGADGGIGTFYNLIPEMFLEVYRLAKANDGAGAMKVQTRINELIEIVLRFPALSAVKRMMTWSGVSCGDVVAPRRSMNSEEEARLIEALATSTFRDAPFSRPQR
jgi:N-acetylneuraminate lyase